MNIFGQNSDSACMDGADIRVLEESHQVIFGAFLEGGQGRSLESEIFIADFLGNLSHHPLERQLPDQEVVAPVPLEMSDFRQCSSTGLFPEILFRLEDEGG